MYLVQPLRQVHRDIRNWRTKDVPWNIEKQQYDFRKALRFIYLWLVYVQHLFRILFYYSLELLETFPLMFLLKNKKRPWLLFSYYMLRRSESHILFSRLSSNRIFESLNNSSMNDSFNTKPNTSS